MSPEMLAIIWYCIVCGELALYVLLDGGNLGVGIISLFPQKDSERTHMMHVLGPIWNANETWLLVAAGTLFGAFPAAYSIGLNALYVPGVVILAGIIGRAVSFEFHAYSSSKHLWMRIFGLSSLVVAAGQGLALGGLLSGIRIADARFAGTLWDWATPITLAITVGIIFSYLVLGYAYLIRRIDYANAHETFDMITIAAGATFLALLGATLILPHANYLFLERWTQAPAKYLLYADAALIACIVALLARDLAQHAHPQRMYFYCLTLFALGMGGMLVGTYPYLLPPSLTIFDAASPANTLRFMLYGIGPLLPIILAYNYYLEHIFAARTDGASY